jgi:hypothetical protein
MEINFLQKLANRPGIVNESGLYTGENAVHGVSSTDDTHLKRVENFLMK